MSSKKELEIFFLSAYDEYKNGEHTILIAQAINGYYKPILRPLSQLTQEIEHNGESFIPMDVLYELFRKTDLFYFDKTNLFRNPYEIIEKLIEWHFDVFGLINDGLAIEKL